jgi:ribonucleoside-diphosphate reductase alpha chain
LKAVAIYRDGCKRSHPLTTSRQEVTDSKEQKTAAAPTAIGENYAPRRRRLPDERRAITHKFQIGSHEGYFTVGLYDDGTPGEVFITMSKQGSVIRGLMDAFATSVSIGLQYGVPLKVLVNKFAHMRFEPSGFTQNPNIRLAKSLVDYIFRWLALRSHGHWHQYRRADNLSRAGRCRTDLHNRKCSPSKINQS